MNEEQIRERRDGLTENQQEFVIAALIAMELAEAEIDTGGDDLCEWAARFVIETTITLNRLHGFVVDDD